MGSILPQVGGQILAVTGCSPGRWEQPGEHLGEEGWVLSPPPPAPSPLFSLGVQWAAGRYPTPMGARAGWWWQDGVQGTTRAAVLTCALMQKSSRGGGGTAPTPRELLPPVQPQRPVDAWQEMGSCLLQLRAQPDRRRLEKGHPGRGDVPTGMGTEVGAVATPEGARGRRRKRRRKRWAPWPIMVSSRLFPSS